MCVTTTAPTTKRPSSHANAVSEGQIEARFDDRQPVGRCDAPLNGSNARPRQRRRGLIATGPAARRQCWSLPAGPHLSCAKTPLPPPPTVVSISPSSHFIQDRHHGTLLAEHFTQHRGPKHRLPETPITKTLPRPPPSGSSAQLLPRADLCEGSCRQSISARWR